MSSQSTADVIRCRSDLSLSETLKSHATVAQANEKIARLEADNPYSIRRRLLATSVRLSERMAPSLHAMAQDCIEKLGNDTPLELYAFASPQYNAMCFKPEDGRLFIMFASSLLEAFDENELKFVLGHELGHHVYRHHDIPIGYILRGDHKPDPRLALSLFTWSRYAEISADRAGAHCAQDIEAVSRALFKLSSGLSGSTIEFHLEDFLKQVEEMQVLDEAPEEKAPKEDWFSTHPFSPLRVKALQLYDKSHHANKEGMSVDALEVAVQGLMSLMEPSYIEGRTDVAESMRRLLFAGALTVANADGEISKEELEIFEGFFGEGSLTDSLRLADLAKELPSRVAVVKEKASLAQRMQVLRDLCVLARADGHTRPVEHDQLNAIAAGLDVRTTFIDQSLCGELTPD